MKLSDEYAFTTTTLPKHKRSPPLKIGIGMAKEFGKSSSLASLRLGVTYPHFFVATSGFLKLSNSTSRM